LAGLASEVADWSAAALSELIDARNADGGWPYYLGQASAAEPTALGALALTAWGVGLEAAAAGVFYVAARQRSDGWFTASVDDPERNWVTPLGAMAVALHGLTDGPEAAVSALLAAPAFTAVNQPRSLYGYDTGIPGWPWTHGDYSYVEPTALAVIFLKQAGRGDHPRVRQAADMLRARALAGGGWNYGEPNILQGELFPTVAPTALALLALADEPDDTTGRALDWLQGQKGQISSLFSLGWSAIALNVLGALNDDWRTGVIGRWTELPSARRSALGTSLCLLGLAGPDNHPFAVG